MFSQINVSLRTRKLMLAETQPLEQGWDGTNF